jgi:hypothetical protein
MYLHGTNAEAAESVCAAYKNRWDDLVDAGPRTSVDFMNDREQNS